MLGITLVLATGLSLRAPPPSARPAATVLFVVPGPGGRRSPFGATSPAPSPEWHAVGSHLASRLSNFGQNIAGDVLTEEDLLESDGVAKRADIIIALGLSAEAAPSLALQKRQATPAALVSYDCAPEVDRLSEVGAYTQSPQGVDVALQPARTALVPWGRVAQGQRLCEQAANPNPNPSPSPSPNPNPNPDLDPNANQARSGSRSPLRARRPTACATSSPR